MALSIRRSNTAIGLTLGRESLSTAALTVDDEAAARGDPGAVTLAQARAMVWRGEASWNGEPPPRYGDLTGAVG